MEAEAEDVHSHTADLEIDVRMARQSTQIAGPRCEDLLPLAGIGSDAKHAREMVEDKCRFREGANQVDQFRKLGVIEPRIK